jgi:hypothetical protein
LRTIFDVSAQGLVPDDVDDCMTSSPFLFLIMSTLGPGLSTEPAVLAYVNAYPEFHQKIRELSAAVSAAGVRVRDFGLLRSQFDGNLRVFAPEEIWMFDLAVDVIAMLGCVQGLSNASLAQFRDNMRTLDEDVASHAWRKSLSQAGNGLPQFHDLRASVPRHAPNPQRYQY